MHSELIALCRQGDRDAYFRVYKLYSKAMYNVAYRITGGEEEAQDVLQEAFTNAFRNLDHYRGEASFGAWLKRIVINKALSALQKRRHDRMPDDEQWDVPEESGEDPEMELTVTRVRKAIQELPDGYRAVISLYLLEGYDHQEIGEIMNISESTSKSQLNRAKNKLRELLGVKVKEDHDD